MCIRDSIVIPKEIRRTLRIREADPLEIFTDREGEIILKKYSPIGEMTTFARQYAESLAQVSGHTVLIADRDQFIAAAGGCRNLIGKPLSREMEQQIESRQIVLATRGAVSYTHLDVYKRQIIGYAELASKHLQETDKLGRYLEKIQICGKELLSMLGNVLDFARIENNKVEMEYIVSNVHECLENCVIMSQQQAESKNPVSYTHLREAPLPRASDGPVLPDLYFLFRHNT